MKYFYIVLVGLFFVGCGNSKEPTESVDTQKEVIIENTKPNTKELNTTKTHIRVLAEDASSKIPEHLLKLPIQTN